MALKQTEKTLVGVALIAGGIALVVGVGLPQFDAYNESNNKLTDLKSQVTDLEAKKSSLAAQIALLEKNTDIPSDIKIKTFTVDSRESVIKQMLDDAVALATGSGNLFISLSPVEVPPMVPPPPPPQAEGEKGAAPSTEATGDPPATGESSPSNATQEPLKEGETPPPPAPTLSTFGYELAIRGTYDSIQRFLQGMAQEKELLEVLAITLENEGNSGTGPGGGSPGSKALANPKSPIKLTATLRLAMQQVNP